ncbi:MAG: META domain-containing protein [Treponema sp.]|jgi:heat shock protein HslJ|nr:META domain-containing protein [Treponema sp.]
MYNKKSKVLIFAAFPFLFALIVLSCANGKDTKNSRAANDAPSGGVGSGIDSIEGKEWLLEELKTGSEIVRINRTQDGFDFGGIYSLTIAEKLISGMAAPNRYSAPYTAGEGKSLTIGLAISTMMAAIVEPESLKEHEFFAYLGKVIRWDLNDGRLELYTSDESGNEAVLVFTLKSPE